MAREIGIFNGLIVILKYARGMVLRCFNVFSSWPCQAHVFQPWMWVFISKIHGGNGKLHMLAMIKNGTDDYSQKHPKACHNKFENGALSSVG